jgi:hypothetical protein
MPIQTFNIYTAKGYAGDLVDSGPAISQTGVVEDATLAVGVAAKRGDTTTNPRHIVVDPAGGNIFGIVRRELALEAKNKPSDGTTEFKQTESASILRQGYIYVTVEDFAVTAGQLLLVNATGGFSGTGGGVATTNVTAEEAGQVGKVIRARIDIVA